MSDIPVPSKTQRKRDARTAFQLGVKLISLSDEQLQQMSIDEDVFQAIRIARSISSHGARKRQLQYLAKLLRNTDIQSIQADLSSIEDQARAEAGRHHRIECWRDYLLQQGDAALTGLCRSHAGLNPQEIRQLIRNAKRQQQRGQPPAAARQLFRRLRQADQQQPLPPVPVISG